MLGSTQEEIDRSINWISIKARELAQALLYEAAQKKKLAAHEKEQSSSVEQVSVTVELSGGELDRKGFFLIR